MIVPQGDRTPPIESEGVDALDPTVPISGYDGIACDLDGVVYHGDQVVPGAPESLCRMVARGLPVVYVTNNASRLPRDVAEQLVALGAPATADDVVTSAQAGAARVAALVPAGAAVMALGGAGVRAALEEEGLRAAAPDEEHVAAVLQGYGPELTVADFVVAARHLVVGVEDTVWVATNTDSTLPQPWGNAPGNGAYVRLLQEATGREPIVVGKPEPPLYERAAARLGGAAMLAIGDRLDTDIDGAAAADIDAAWVLTGVHLPSDLLRRPTTALPRYIVGGLAELEQPYAAAVASEDGWVCGSHRVRLDTRSGQLRLEGPAPAGIEAVRAGLAALVEARDAATVPIQQLIEAARTLDGIASTN